VNAPTIAPIDTSLENKVIRRTNDLIDHASELFAVNLQRIPISFNLRGRAAGMFRVQAGRQEIRYNPWIFSRHFHDNLSQTVAHEVAHYVVDQLFGRRGIRPHGKEWQNVMIALGHEPRATCDYDLEGIPRRTLKYFTYRCDCSHYHLSSIRHNRINLGKARYLCPKCNDSLKFVSEDSSQ